MNSRDVLQRRKKVGSGGGTNNAAANILEDTLSTQRNNNNNSNRQRRRARKSQNGSNDQKPLSIRSRLMSYLYRLFLGGIVVALIWAVALTFYWIDPRIEEQKNLMLPSCPPPESFPKLFYVRGDNNGHLMQKWLEQKGWKPAPFVIKPAEGTQIKWEDMHYYLGSNSDWPKITFRYIKGIIDNPKMEMLCPGQLINRIENQYELTEKDKMIRNFINYENFLTSLRLPSADEVPPGVRCIGGIQWRDFHPETWNLPERAHEFFSEQPCESEKNETDLWIVKIPTSAQGIGLNLINNLQNLRSEYIHFSEDKCRHERNPADVAIIPRMERKIVQKYIHPPLLLNGKKFDIRVYMLIASTDPMLVFFLTGHTCVCIENYDPNDLSNDFRHISNGHIQKHHPLYESLKPEINQELRSIQKYLDETNYAPPDWVDNVLVPRIKEIMVWSINSVKPKLGKGKGQWALFGSDFIIDQQLNVWLVEHNWFPGFGDDTPVLAKQAHARAKDVIQTMLEVRERQVQNRNYEGVEEGTDFELLIDESQHPPYYFAFDSCV